MKLGEGFIEVRPDTSRFKQELQQNVETDAASVSRRLGQALAGGAFLVGAKKAVDAASSLQQAVGGTEAVFGRSADAVEDWSKRAAESAGLSERAARELTAQIGGLLKGFGFTTDEAAGLSTQLAQLGADLSATFGGKPEEAVQALAAALRGETDPIERYGISLNQAAVNAKAVELGLAATTSAVDQHAKAQATLAIITERSADAQGQFAREADTAAGQAAISAAKAENASADLGENLLPIYTKLSETVGHVADAFGALPEPVQTGIIAIAGIAALTGPVKAAYDSLSLLATIARTRVTQGLDRAATGAYDLAGGLGRIGTTAIGVGTQLGLIYAAVQLLDREASHADLSKLSNALLDLSEGGKVGGEAASVLGEDLQTLRSAIEDVTAPSNVAKLENAVHTIGRLGQDDRGSLEQSRQVLADLDQALADLAAQDPEAASAALDAITKGLDPADAERLLGLLDKYDSALAATDTSARTAADATGEMGDAAGGAAPKVGELGDKLDINDEAAKRAADSVDAFREAVERALQPLDLQGAVDQRTQALHDIAAGIDERAQAVADARQRIKDLQATKPEDRPDDFARQMADAQAQLQEALDATSLTLEGNTDAALRNREELRGLVDDSIGVIEAARDQGEELDDLKTRRFYEIQSLRDQLTQMGYNAEEIESYIDVIESIPLTKETTITADTAKAELQIKGWLARMQAEIDENPLSVDVLQAEKFAAGPRRLPGHAAGGSVFDGDFLVGEAGTELLRKRGSDLEVIAGSPLPVGGAGLNAELLASQRNIEALLMQIAGNTAGPTTGQRLRRVQTMAGAV